MFHRHPYSYCFYDIRSFLNLRKKLTRGVGRNIEFPPSNSGETDRYVCDVFPNCAVTFAVFMFSFDVIGRFWLFGLVNMSVILNVYAILERGSKAVSF